MLGGMKQRLDRPSPSLGRFLLAVVAVLFLLLMADNLVHDPVEQPTAHLVLFAVQAYRAHLSESASQFGVCRFVPTCSDYMVMAVFRHGSIRGVLMGCGRIARCSPFSDRHGIDYP